MRLKYVLSEVAVGLWRNVTMTIAMIITMAVSLTLLGASVLLYLQVDKMRQVYYEQVEVTIFLKTQESSTAQRDAIDADLKVDELVDTYDEGPLVEACAELGVQLVASAPLMQGQLSGGLPAPLRGALPACDTDAQRAIEFVRRMPGITAALVGMRSAAHVDENLGGARRST